MFLLGFLIWIQLINKFDIGHKTSEHSLKRLTFPRSIPYISPAQFSTQKLKSGIKTRLEDTPRHLK